MCFGYWEWVCWHIANADINERCDQTKKQTTAHSFHRDDDVQSKTSQNERFLESCLSITERERKYKDLQRFTVSHYWEGGREREREAKRVTVRKWGVKALLRVVILSSSSGRHLHSVFALYKTQKITFFGVINRPLGQAKTSQTNILVLGLRSWLYGLRWACRSVDCPRVRSVF